jgi:raffinose/stachyose/melibiose transport system permease protein
LLVGAGVVVIPLLMTALGGFKTVGELRTNAFGLPSEWRWWNYADIVMSRRYWLQMWNSLVIAVLTVGLTVACSAMAAFVFAHVRFLGSRMLLNYFLLGLMFPAATAILPLFIRIRDLGLIDTYMGVVLPQVAFGLAVSILLFRNYFRNLPRDFRFGKPNKYVNR